MEEKLKIFVKETVEEVMGLDIESFDKDSKINTISEWDSFNNLMLISKFQEDMNVEFTATEIENVQTIGDLYKLIEGKSEKNE